MKNCGACILVGLFLLQVFSASLILVNYEINTDYIIENFCENTDKLEMQCNGKCHLAKQIEADTNQKSESPAAPTEASPLAMMISDIPSFQFEFWQASENDASSRYLEGDYTGLIHSIFHPPQVQLIAPKVPNMCLEPYPI